MDVWRQFKETGWEAPKTVFQLKARAAAWLVKYLLTALAIFGLFACLILLNEDALRNALLNYLFPESWHGVMEKLVDFFFQSQAKMVLSCLIINVSIVIASVVLFPLKEGCSAAFERESGLHSEVVEEYPLIYQVWGEIKLFVLVTAAQLTALWIGYYAFEWTRWFSIILSLVILFFVFALDLISPTLQRHQVPYSIVLKVLFNNPVLSFGFGALYTLPPLVLSRYILSLETLSLFQMAAIIFSVNLVFLALAIPGGTRLAAVLLTQARKTALPSLKQRVWGYSLTLLLFCVSSLLHTRLALSLHHKSQFFKCEYNVDWSSIEFNLPSWQSIKEGKPVNSLTFDLEAKNPTSFDLVVENSVLTVEQYGQVVATINIAEFSVKAGETVVKKIQINTAMEMESLAGFSELWDGWKVNLEFDLWPGIPFLINLI